MKDFKIFCDSSCDLPEEFLTKYQITCVPFYVSFDKQNYKRERKSASADSLYVTMQSRKTYPNTSPPNVQDYISQFKKEIQKNNNILCLCLAAKLSGSYQSAINAKTILEEDFPECSVRVINSAQVSACEGLTILQAAYMKAAGLSLPETAANLCLLRKTSSTIFTVGTPDHLIKGGYISKLSSLTSNFLNTKPLIQLKDGELFPHPTRLDNKKPIDRIIHAFKEHFKQSNLNYSDYDYCIAYCDKPENAQKLHQSIEIIIDKKISIPPIVMGITSVSYTGPGTLALCFIQKYQDL